MTTEQKLLHKTLTILDRAREISILKGESFNIFTLLGVESDEVRLHNRFIGELLNPFGSHKQGAVFLNLFYDYLINSEDLSLTEDKKQIVQLIRNSNVQVRSEYWLGNKHVEEIKGGSLDICIISPIGQIRIENKIYAVDQASQIARYCHNHNTEKNIVLYWNMFGTDPSPESRLKMEKGSDYFILSHQTDTLNWLNLCIKEACNQPILRETIKQYHLLIQKLTYQNQSSHMKKELIQLLLENKDNYLAAKTISEHLIHAKASIYEKVLDALDIILISTKHEKMQRPRSMRSDGGFIPIIELIQDDVLYDVGLNLELDNNYSFFCVIERGKNRSYSGINNWNQFDHLANYLDKKAYLTKRGNTRTGWSLSGTYFFTNRFEFLNYIELPELQRKELITEISKDVLSVINSSELVMYSASSSPINPNN